MEADYIVYIVDDEVLIGNSLAKLLKRHYEERIALRVFSNPVEAMNEIIATPCDLLISDIRMPGMTGLEMVAQLRAKNIGFETILLTGYDMFEYAYDAIKQDACGYLLKNEPDECVIREVDKALGKINNRRAFINRLHTIQSDYDRLHRQYIRQMMRDYIRGNELTDADELGAAYGEDERVTLILGCDALEKPIPARESEIVLQTVEDLLPESGAICAADVMSMTIGRDLLWLIRTGNVKSTNVLYDALSPIYALVDEHISGNMLFVIARHAVAWRDLPRQYERLKRVKAYHVRMHQSGIATEREDEAESAEAPSYETGRDGRALVRRCINLLEEGRLDGVCEGTRQLCSFLEKNEAGERDTCVLLYMEFVTGLIQFAQRNALMDNLSRSDIEELERLSGDIKWQEKTALLERVTEQIVQLCTANERDRIVLLSEQIKRYVQQHLEEDLSCATLARSIGYSEAHLAKLFKTAQAVTLHQYVLECRMVKAKELLADPAMRIYEIACRCGYNNTSYFIRVFKSQVDMTPAEYREKIQVQYI